MSRTVLYGLDPQGRSVPIQVNPNGAISGLSGSCGLPSGAGQPLAPWSYAAASGGITDTSDVTLAAAPGAGKSNYLVSLQLENTSATATEVVIKSGSTVLWRGKVGASMTGPVSVHFNRPLIAANNTAMTAACITTATVTYINAQGYADVTLAELNAEQTSAIEIFDQSGDQVFDAAGNPVYQ